MKRIAVIGVFIICTIGAISYANTLRVERNDNYIVIQFEKPASKEGPAILNVIWCQGKPDPKIAEKVLIEAYQIADHFKVDYDILGSVWYSPTGRDEDEEKVTLASGVRSYVKEKGKVKPEPFL